MCVCADNKTTAQVCNRVASTIVLNGKDTYCKRFVIDYTGCPIAFEGCVGSVNFNNCPPKFMTDVPPMGEADIKFLRWSDHFRKADMIAFSIDGDFIPIALIRREQQLLRRKLWDQEQQQQQQKQPCPEAPLDATKKPPSPPPVANIAIYRIKYRVPGSATAASAPQKCTSISANKRQKLNGTGDDATKYQNLIVQPKGPGGSLGLAAPPQLVAQSRQETSIDNKKERCNSVREWEYVDIPKLHAAMQAAFSRMCPMVARNPLHKFHYMRMLAVLIGLSGTDFSRGLPLVGPGTLWNMLGDGGGVLAALLRAYNLKEGLIDSAAARDGLAACIYMSKFASHFRDARFSLADKKTGTKKRSHKTSSAAASAITIIESSSEDDAPSDSSEDDCGGGTESHRGGFQRSLGVLKASSLSERTRNDLPSAFRVEVTMRNINWLLRYWECVPPVRCAASDEEDNSGGWDYSGCYPDPICDEYGFKARSRTGKGKGKALPASSLPSIQWLDEDDEGGGSGEKRTRKGKDKRHKGSDDEDNDDF